MQEVHGRDRPFQFFLASSIPAFLRGLSASESIYWCPESEIDIETWKIGIMEGIYVSAIPWLDIDAVNF
jgi:hypothetical protein